MITSKNKLLIGGVVVVALVLLGAGAWYYHAKVQVAAFPLHAGEQVSSWEFKGAYSGNDTLITQANADIQKLTDLLGKGQYDDYDLHIGMGNDYALMGNGAKAFEEYNKAIHIHQEKGLAYTNVANLFNQLGLYESAADAYTKAVSVEGGTLEYHLERLNYLTRQFPTDNARILAAFTDASTQFGDNASILAIEAQWLTGQGKYAEAIKAWQRAKLLSPGRDTSAMDAEIARLQKKL